MADKKRPDDSALIDSMEGAPGQGGVKGGTLQRDIASRAEEEHEVDDKQGVTRVHKSDEKDEAERSRQSDR